MKKLVSSLAIATMLGTTLVGCSGNQPTADSSDAALDASSLAAIEPASEIEFWYCLGGDLGKEVENLVARFNESQDKIKVTPVFQGSYSEANGKLQQALVSKTQPAITMVDRGYYYLYESTNNFEDLTPYMEKDNVDANDFFEGLMPVNLYNNEGVYALPFNRSTVIMYYNKDMFAEVGLDPEKAPTTWDELFDYAKKLSIPGQRWGFTTMTEVWPLKAFIGQAGGEIINAEGTDIGFKDGSGAEALNVWLTMMADDSIKVNAANAFGQTSQDFLQQQVGMMMGSTAELANFINNAEFEFNTAFLPVKDRASTPTGGANLAILANSSPEEKAAAWEFLKFATTPEQIFEFSKNTGYVPTRKSCANLPQFQELWAQHPQYKVAFDHLEFAEDTANHIKWAELKNEMWSIMQAVLFDNKYTPEEAVEEMSKAAQRVLK